MKKPEFMLLTGRTVYQGVGKEKGKLTDDYMNSVAICEMDPEDMKSMKIKENSNVKIITDFGSVILKAVPSQRAPHSKILFIPYGPWASLLMGSSTDSTGMPSLKGIPAIIEPAATERILNVFELLKKNYGKV